MSVKNFIPQLWSASILRGLQNAHVAVATANRSYEGEISRAGDTVNIQMIGDIDIGSYTGAAITWQELDDATRQLVIDQQKYFAFTVDDVDQRQATGDILGEAAMRAAYKLRDTADAYLLGLYAQAGGSQNSNASPVDMTSANVEDEFLAVGEAMNDAGVPEEGRFAIIPPWVRTKLTLAGIIAKTENTELYRSGYLSRALGFDFLMSQNVSKNSASWDQTRIICGVRGESFAYAEQIVDVKAVEREDYFDDGVKGLHVYGGKILRPDMTWVLYADKTAEA